METIFSVPMRTNNNARYESGDRNLSEIIDLAMFGRITIKIGVDQCQPGNSILLSYHLHNFGMIFHSQDLLITEPGDKYLSVSASAIGPDTMVNGIIHTNGQARYSVDIVALEPNEDFPGQPMDDF